MAGPEGEDPRSEDQPEQEIVQVMLTPKDGGNWFPGERIEKVEVKGQKVSASIQYPGASIRDVFAIKCLQGVLANQDQLEKVSDLADLFNADDGKDPNSETWIRALTHFSYEIADAMLKERGSAE